MFFFLIIFQFLAMFIRHLLMKNDYSKTRQAFDILKDIGLIHFLLDK